jgi:hypothetical protein
MQTYDALVKQLVLPVDGLTVERKVSEAHIK